MLLGIHDGWCSRRLGGAASYARLEAASSCRALSCACCPFGPRSFHYTSPLSSPTPHAHTRTYTHTHTPTHAHAPTPQGIISGLRQFEDEGAQLSALTELSELLSISQEESLAATMPVEQVVPLLVSRAVLSRARGRGGRAPRAAAVLGQRACLVDSAELGLPRARMPGVWPRQHAHRSHLSLIHISEPTRQP